MVKMLKAGSLLTINDNGKYLLIEFPHDIIPRSVEKLLFEIKMSGVTPIITHPERNQEIQRNPQRVHDWVSSGSLIQITAASFTGKMGKSAKSCAFQLLKGGYVHVVASDAHSPTWRAPGLSEAKKILSQELSEDKIKEIFEIWPTSIIQGEAIDILVPEEIDSPKKRKWFFW